MTDKQIIIDGIDVSGCGYYFKHTRTCLVKMHASGKYYYCNEWCNCDFKKLSKQLQAKEQECEELKPKLLNLLGKEGLRQSEKEFYEQQLDQLKEQLEAYKMEAEEGKEINAELKAENEELKKKLNCINIK